MRHILVARSFASYVFRVEAEFWGLRWSFVRRAHVVRTVAGSSFGVELGSGTQPPPVVEGPLHLLQIPPQSAPRDEWFRCTYALWIVLAEKVGHCKGSGQAGPLL